MKKGDDSEPTSIGADSPIIAATSQWFFRRCFLLAGLLGAMALYFCYDGFIGYPRQNRNAALYEAFVDGKEKAPMAATSKVDSLTEDAYRAGAEGKSWAAHAASLHLPAQPPKRHTVEDLRTQKRIASALGISCVLALVWALAHRGRAWRMQAGRISSPWNTEFAATSVTDIDRRRWDRGVALLISHDGARFLKLKLDDYKYQDAGQIIDEIAKLHPEVRIEPPLGDSNRAILDENR